jgi:hypothetical protein
LWGGLTAAFPLIRPQQYPLQAMRIGTMLEGLIIIGLGVIVYRRVRWAAWTLVAIALLEIGARLVTHVSGVLMPFILFAFALVAVRQLRRESNGPATVSP